MVDKYECQHYLRKCEKQCPKCEEFFPCRLCHNLVKYEGEKDPKKAHELDRFKVKKIKC